MKYKAISVKQPWAALIAARVKWIETRTWVTEYRGPLVIVSSLKPDQPALQSIYTESDVVEKVEPYLLYGRALARGLLVDCRPMEKQDESQAHCPLYDGAFAWVLQAIEPLEPFPVRGRLGLYEVEVPE